ncbi:glycosyltransferase family A protein [Roseivirga misakiensis]|uniref:Glycosyltransferase 2-like domain-containing protein n=1 Tax=Roseivirga misakiensis TaxID=1563681 RepID=A0A1E5T1H3_9BACT|nr:glycosyltransferase family 2 protein [Roseivirga misakiensis]OEK05211.1 hypothetical protein BFP71_17565 [Roseivirga misakiensis]
MMQKHLVSLVVPVFNRDAFLSETIESVISQTHTNWELILIDDGSADESFKIAQNFAQNDSRIISAQRKREPKGAPTCRNIGLDMATGDFMMFLDSDDLLSVNCLKNRVAKLTAEPDLDFVVYQTALFDAQTMLADRLWSSLKHQSDLQAFVDFEGWCISSTCFRTDFVKHYRFFETAKCLQDWSFHIEILKSKPAYQKFPESAPDVYIRAGHSDRISQTNTESLERVKSRFDVLDKVELSLQSEAELSMDDGLLRQYFLYLQNVAIQRSKSEFNALLKSMGYFTRRKSFKLSRIKFFIRLHSTIKSSGLGFLNGLLFRLNRHVFMPKLAGPTRRIIRLDKPFKVK